MVSVLFDISDFDKSLMTSYHQLENLLFYHVSCIFYFYAFQVLSRGTKEASRHMGAL